ncbi:MAG: hypothetical protein ACXADH_02365 [Candidatus Kariarchaeaceae archaeon]
MEKLPSHVPVKISPEFFPKLRTHLMTEGYHWTLFQIVKPKQLFGVVKKMTYENQLVEHHIRGYLDGELEAEFELCRLSNIINHLTTTSYSAHHKLMDILTNINVKYHIDKELMSLYDTHARNDFPRDFMEFPKWLFGGVLFWTPLGVLWRIGYEFKQWLKRRLDKQNLQRTENIPIAD